MRRFTLTLLGICLLSGWLVAETSLGKLGRDAGRLRGLSYRDIPSRAVSQQEASAYVLRLLKKELATRQIDVREALLKELRLMPAQADSRQIYRQIYASQVRGLYDPDKKQYVVVKGGGGGAGNLESLGAGLGLNVTDLYTVHELGHAIQDQHFNLSEISKRVADSFDQSFAASSLIEGDASVLMMDYMLGSLGLTPDALGGLGGGGMDLSLLSASDPNLASAPLFFRESVTGPYTHGTQFVTALKRQGGWKRVDRAFKRIPTTSEQIFHPEKFVQRIENPRKVSLAGLPKSIGGYAALGEDRAGEFTARIMEQELTGLAGEASAGWGGDRYRVYTKGQQRFVIWHTVWDSPRDAKEFADLAASNLARGAQKKDRESWLRGGRLYRVSRKGQKVDLQLGVPPELADKL